MCQNKPVWPQSVDSPNLKLRIEASSLWLVFSRRTQRDKVRVGAGPCLSFSGSTRPGPGSELQLQRPHHLLFGTRNLREGCAETQAFRKPEKKILTMCPCSQPLAALLPMTKPAHLPPPHPHLGCGVRRVAEGLPGPQPWPTTVMSPLLFPDPHFGQVLQDLPNPLSADPSLEPVPPPPLAFKLSPHLQIILIIWGT